MFVPNPVQLRNKLRSDRHVAELIEEQILHANKDNVVVGKLLPRKLAGSNNRERALRCLQQSTEKEGSLGLSKSSAIAARWHLCLVQAPGQLIPRSPTHPNQPPSHPPLPHLHPAV